LYGGGNLIRRGRDCVSFDLAYGLKAAFTRNDAHRFRCCGLLERGNVSRGGAVQLGTNSPWKLIGPDLVVVWIGVAAHTHRLRETTFGSETYF